MDKNIKIVSRDKCTGCGACFNKCPKNAIVMEYDNEGFLYPKVTDECINCGLCVAVCPAIKEVKFYDTPKSYAVWADDEIRLISSSGGMFTLMANYVLEHGGAVCGARYSEDWQTVYHTWAHTKEELSFLRGSKYVQSDVKNTYKEAKDFLENGRLVLYTGCPCQVAGLYSYLGKDYENLYTADLICHCSNSVTAYQSFLEEFTEGKEIKKVDFRDKKLFSWSTPTVVYLKDGSVKKASWDKSIWYKGFLNGLINRLCCYNCRYARAERVSDITLGDCWQVYRINQDYDDRKGTSLVLVNSEKGSNLMKLLSNKMKLCKEIPLKEIRKYNGQLNWPVPKHQSRDIFFAHLQQVGYHKALKYGTGEFFDIGIVGWWFASNYGSSLTYYALGTILKDMGKQVLFLPIAKIDGTPWEKATETTIAFISKYFRVGKKRDFDNMREFNYFCDSFMLGSDQMWTASTINLVGYTFFLDFVDKNKKKIAFSTSFGHDNFYGNELTCSTVSDFLQRFDAISVREKTGINICKDKFNVIAEQVIDPVFLLPANKYDLILSDVKIKPDEKKYLLCYILDPSIEKEKAAQSIAEHENLEILVMFGMKEYDASKNNWHTGKILPKVTTPEFLAYIKHSSFILTDSHHGACFAIIYEKPYAAMVNSNRGSTRFETIAELLNLKERLVYNPLDILNNEKIYQKVDWQEVNKHIIFEKEKAYMWLNNALNSKVKISNDTLNTIRVDNERKYYGINNRVQQLNKRVSELQNSVKILKEYHELENDISKLRIQVFKELNNNKKSYFIDKFKGGIRCYKENGFIYTLKRIVLKIKNKLS